MKPYDWDKETSTKKVHRVGVSKPNSFERNLIRMGKLIKSDCQTKGKKDFALRHVIEL